MRSDVTNVTVTTNKNVGRHYQTAPLSPSPTATRKIERPSLWLVEK